MYVTLNRANLWKTASHSIIQQKCSDPKYLSQYTEFSDREVSIYNCSILSLFFDIVISQCLHFNLGDIQELRKRVEFIRMV